MKSLFNLFILPVFFIVACNNNESEKQAAPAGAPVVEKMNAVQTAATPSLNGLWELTDIAGIKTDLAKLYPRQKPNLNFDLQSGAVRGSTACNRFLCQVKIEGEKMNFGDPAITKVACPGDGEKVFLEALKKINSFSIIDSNFLQLRADSLDMMRFSKKR